MSTVTVPTENFPWIKDQFEEIETPFQDDFWGREALATRLTDYVSRLKVGATIAIDAEWGAGKSWFVKNWQAQLNQNDFKVIYLNAFNQDYIDDPFLTISMEIANCIKSDASSFDSIKETIGNAYRAILPNLPMLLWYLTTSLVGMGAIAKPVADAVAALQSTDAFGEKAAELLNEKLQEHLSAQVENYENEKKSLEYFKTQLAEITKQQDKPLVFIIDELDRCKPEFAIRLIERIKHFFDIPNVVFILAVNKKQLEESINKFYGFTTADNYLEKFIDFTIALKNQDTNGKRYRQILLKYSEEQQLNIESYIDYYITLCKIYKPNPRKLIRIINKFSLLKHGLDDGKTLFLFLVLIYNELNLIETFNEESFVNHFYDIHKNYYQYKINNMASMRERNNYRNGDVTYDFLSTQVYSLNNSELFSYFFYFIRYIKFKENDFINCKNVYHPEMRTPNEFDLIETWHKFIHMVTD